MLNGINLEIGPGEKVACVGRTGAGKSSLIQALFRMTEIDPKPFSKILVDDIDTKKIGLSLLRRNISIIP